MAGRIKSIIRALAKGHAHDKAKHDAYTKHDKGEEGEVVFRGIRSTVREIVTFSGKRVIMDKRQSFKTSKGSPVYFAVPRNRNKYDPRTASRPRELERAARRASVLRSLEEIQSRRAT